MNIDFSNPFVQGVIASLVAAVIFALFVGFLKILRNRGQGLFDFFRRGFKEKTGLDTYLNTLADKTLRISHPWMKEDQYLTDILVPIYFEVNQMAQREELETYLAREYKKNPALRLVITGKPGSGKTIAMRVMARALAAMDPDSRPVPVLLAFTDIKGLTDPQQLEQPIIEKLKVFQFELGEKTNIAERFVKENLYERKNKWLNGLLGPVVLIVIGILAIPVIRIRQLFLLLSYLLAAGSLLIPFHNLIFKIFFFFSFFIFGQLFFEANHIGFTLFNLRNVKNIQEFLGETGKEKIEAKKVRDQITKYRIKNTNKFQITNHKLQ